MSVSRGVFGFLGGALGVIVLRAAVVGNAGAAIGWSGSFVNRLVNPAVPLIGSTSSATPPPSSSSSSGGTQSGGSNSGPNLHTGYPAPGTSSQVGTPPSSVLE